MNSSEPTPTPWAAWIRYWMEPVSAWFPPKKQLKEEPQPKEEPQEKDIVV